MGANFSAKGEVWPIWSADESVFLHGWHAEKSASRESGRFPVLRRVDFFIIFVCPCPIATGYCIRIDALENTLPAHSEWPITTNRFVRIFLAIALFLFCLKILWLTACLQHKDRIRQLVCS
jgi:hypothetical protein